MIVKIYCAIIAVLILAVIFLIEKLAELNLRKNIYDKIVICFTESLHIGALRNFNTNILCSHYFSMQQALNIEDNYKISEEEKCDLDRILEAYKEYMLKLYFSEKLFHKDNSKLEHIDFFALYLSYFLAEDCGSIFEERANVASKINHVSLLYCQNRQIKNRLYCQNADQNRGSLT
jgi:hypothetical protein